MSAAVLNALQLPESTRMNCKMRAEGGGAYPVHLRLTRADAAPLAVGLVSPSCCSPVWCAIVADTRTRCYLRLYVSDRLEPAALQVIFAKIAEYTRAGFTGAGELVAAIRVGSTRYDPDLIGAGATAAGVTKLSMGIRTDAALEIHRMHGFLNRKIVCSRPSAMNVPWELCVDKINNVV